MTRFAGRRSAWRWVATLVSLGIVGCGALPPKGEPPMALYGLDEGLGADVVAQPRQVTAQEGRARTLTLLVNPPQAAAGHDSRHIVYLREPQRLEAYALSQWVDTPARMLAPLIVAALAPSPHFRAIVSLPGAVAGDLRLDTEILRLQQQFGTGPSQVRFSLRARLVDARTLRLVAVHDFDRTVVADTDDARGGVHAASRAVRQVLGELAAFCEATADVAR